MLHSEVDEKTWGCKLMNSSVPNLGEEKSQELWTKMRRIRMVEEAIAEKYSEQEMRCPVHLSIGQEAAAVGVCEALNGNDWVFSGHRNHAHYLAKGGDLKKMLAEIYGKETGCCGGKGGSMHLTDLNCGFIGATPIVGSTIPIAVGAALTAQKEGKGRIVVVFIGDGAMETGVVHESLNFAQLRSLPILFVCENNLYSVYSPLEVRQPSNRSLTDLARGHGVSSMVIDGNDVNKIYAETSDITSKMRAESRPYFIELPTYRWREHCGPNFDNHIGYRSEIEYQQWKEKDPLTLNNYQQSTENIEDEISSAFIYAKNSNFPSQAAASKNVYPKAVNDGDGASIHQGREITYAQSIREAQDQLLNTDKSTYLMGLGVPDPKGIFGTCNNLQEKYGSERVFDIPLSENAMTGVAIGSAITGQRPILTHQRVDFALVSIDQIVNQAAKWHYMFNGQMMAPIVIRMVIGRGWGQGPQHSQSLHAWFSHIPGLRVIMPSNAYDAKGMLIAAIKDNSPVIYLEHRWLHHVKGFVPEQVYSASLDKAKVINEGNDITIIGISYMVLECLQAANNLKALGISAEIIDLRSIKPLDMETILMSTKKTKRILVVDQAEQCCGVGAEIISKICETMGDTLYEKPIRLNLPAHPAPTSPKLCQDYYPTSQNIEKVVSHMFNKETSINSDRKQGSEFNDQPNPDFCGPF